VLLCVPFSGSVHKHRICDGSVTYVSQYTGLSVTVMTVARAFSTMHCNTNLYVSTTVFITQGNYIGYMFRLINSYLQAYSLQVKSQDVHTLGAQCVYISEIFKPYNLPSLSISLM